MATYCAGCGAWVELDAGGTCPAGHRQPVPEESAASLPDLPIPPAPAPPASRPVPLPLPVPEPPPARVRPRFWVALGSVVALAVCFGLAVVAVDIVKGAAYPPGKPYPPYPRESATPYVAPTWQQQHWALGLSAVLAAQNGAEYDTLSGVQGTPTAEWSAQVKMLLERDWGIRSREDLLDALAWIENGGHRRGFDRKTGGEPGRQTIAAWDYGRYVFLCRWGYAIGYLSEDEAWQRIMPVARLMQATYLSWGEFGHYYVEGREFWSPNASNAAEIRDIVQELQADPESPWTHTQWQLDLTQPPAGGSPAP